MRRLHEGAAGEAASCQRIPGERGGREQQRERAEQDDRAVEEVAGEWLARLLTRPDLKEVVERSAGRRARRAAPGCRRRASGKC